MAISVKIQVGQTSVCLNSITNECKRRPLLQRWRETSRTSRWTGSSIIVLNSTVHPSHDEIFDDFRGSMIFAKIFTWWPEEATVTFTWWQAEWQVLDSGSAVLPDGDPDVIRKISYIINHLGSNSINDCLAGQDPLNNFFSYTRQKRIRS